MFGYRLNYSEMFKPDEVLEYLRKSRSDDPSMTVEEVLEKHETMLDEWAERNLGAKVPEENKYREVVSAETLGDRPAIQKILRLIESPKIKAILCVDAQRLTRGDLMDAGLLIRTLRYTSTVVITPMKAYDLRDDYDRDAFERELKRGNEYLEYFKKIQKRGREQSVRDGNFIGNIPPYGYDKAVVMDGKRKCPTLAINEEQADVVRMIFDLYVNKDMGRTNICHHLDGLGIAPPKGKYWSPAALKDLLANDHYIGKVRWYWRKTVTVIEDGEVSHSRPKQKEYMVFDGKHEAIISEELFYAAREKQGRNNRAKPSTTIRNPFASLIYCKCGRAMILRTHKLPDGTDRCAPRLICDDQVHCHTGSCLVSEMADHVSNVLRQCIEDFELKAKEDTGDSRKFHLQQIKRLEKELADLEAKELAQWEMQSDPDPNKRMPQDIFQKLSEKLRAAKEQTREALNTAYNTIPDPVDYVEKADKFKDALEALHDPSRSAKEKNMLLKECIERIEYHRDKPERVKRLPGEKKGTRMRVGGKWTDPPIEIDVRLRV